MEMILNSHEPHSSVGHMTFYVLHSPFLWPIPGDRLIIMTSSNGNIFRVTGTLCGKFTGPGEFPTQRPVTRSFDVFFDLRLNKRLSKQSWCWWFEMPSCSLWCHCNDTDMSHRTSQSWAWHLLTIQIHTKFISNENLLKTLSSMSPITINISSQNFAQFCKTSILFVNWKSAHGQTSPR